MNKMLLKSLLSITILTVSVFADPPAWSVNHSEFEMSASVTAVLYLDYEETDNANRSGFGINALSRSILLHQNTILNC
ncbi:MAG: hypothetical protein KAU06_06040 [Candidatus Marinimicrobia bacterium]|nr:hypothetical protein [Candidatus Neomarinimicrobiota bacterium]